MNSQNNNGFEWINIDEKELQYHVSQYENPKEYTKSIITFISNAKLIDDKSVIIDLGCGCGAITNLLANKYPESSFIGLDLNDEYIKIATRLSKPNCKFSKFDLYDSSDLESLNKNELNDVGLICLQTLSWLPNYSKFVELLANIKPKWILVTSLFYDGLVDAEIKIKDYTRKMGDITDFRESFYNIYSIPKFNEELEKVGYEIEIKEPFIINIDLNKPVEGSGMATFTEKLENGNRIQVSGPLLMSWYTLLIKQNI